MSENKVDLHLIHEVKRGNKRAFDSLVLKYQYKVLKLVTRYISDPTEALDITQESFVKIYKALNRFRGDSSFYTWLYRIVINTAKNHMIANGRQLSEYNKEFSEHDIEQFIIKNNIKEYSTPEYSLMCNEIEHMLFGAIKELPTDLRTVIMLREIDGLAYDEIATIMACPIGTVRSRIFRARELIEKRVNPLRNNR